MIKTHSEFLRSSTPKRQRIILTFCGIFTLLFSLFYIVWAIYNGQFLSQLSRCLIFVLMMLVILWFLLKILFYSITATDRGLKTDNIIGANKLFDWKDIIEIRRPRFGFPVNFTYVISKNKDKLFLIKNKKNYKELIKYIKENAPNLKICNP